MKIKIFAVVAVAVAILGVTVTASAGTVVDQGAPGHQGPWPVTAGTYFDGGPSSFPVTQAYTTSRLSADGGDQLAVAAPDGGAAGYALSPQYTAGRASFSDQSTSHVITKWIMDANTNEWRPAGQINSTARTTAGTGEVVFDQGIIVGAGRIAFQLDDTVDAGGVKIEFTVEVRP